MVRNISIRVGISLLAAGLALLLQGCVYPAAQQDWQWKQYNPNYQPLPGDPYR